MLVFFKDPEWIDLVFEAIPLLSPSSSSLVGGLPIHYKTWESVDLLEGPSKYPLFTSIYDKDLENLKEIVKVYGLVARKNSFSYRGLRYPSVILEYK